MDPKQLEKFDIFNRMPSALCSSIAEKASLRSYAAEETILQQEEKAEYFYGLVSGEVELRFIFRDRILKSDVRHEESVVRKWETVDTPVALETLHPGDLFGWSSLVSHKAYTGSVVATQSCEAMAIRAGELRELLDSDPSAGYMFMNTLSEIIASRLHWRTDKLLESWIEAFGVQQVK